MNRSLLCIVGCSGWFKFKQRRLFRNVEDKITLRFKRAADVNNYKERSHR